VSKVHSPTGEWEGQIKTRKECERARATHKLKSADRGTSEDTERTRVREGRPLSGEHRERDMSGHGENASKRGVLANWGVQTKEQVRIWKEWAVGSTHVLETADRETSQDTGKNPSEREALTN
jgi:hypothetical protein